ncbi:MAG: hypothetical protein NC412_06005 [Roseburia sp.]|nr:hypothetical protein [Roseburia sp.]MCM1277399.1 hypothetical protein [Robinsoniella sp.]
MKKHCGKVKKSIFAALFFGICLLFIGISVHFGIKEKAEKVSYQVEGTNATGKADENIENDEQWWDGMQDTDGDGLPDVYEEEIGTEIENPDTDWEGLPDGFEILYASSDPLKLSTLDNEISDADGDEILIGLNPLNGKTFGYPDLEHKSTQKLDYDHTILEEINQDNSDYKLSLELEAKGNIFSGLLVRESAYAAALENDSILGRVVEIIYEDEENLENIRLNFKITLGSTLEEYSSKELEGIKRYNIFWFDETENLLVPLNTTVDEEAGTISTLFDRAGTYCIVDIGRWMNNFSSE